jgi:DNA gyrase subunit A
MGRSTQGVTLINLGKGETLAGLERVAEGEDEVEGNGNGEGEGAADGEGAE